MNHTATSLIKNFSFQVSGEFDRAGLFLDQSAEAYKMGFGNQAVLIDYFRCTFFEEYIFKKSVNERIVENAFVLSQISNAV